MANELSHEGLAWSGPIWVGVYWWVNVDSLTLRLLMSYIYIYIYGAPILDVFRSHTTTQHSR